MSFPWEKKIGFGPITGIIIIFLSRFSYDARDGATSIPTPDVLRTTRAEDVDVSCAIYRLLSATIIQDARWDRIQKKPTLSCN